MTSNQIIKGVITRKSDRAPLCLEILLSPDQAFIPPIVEIVGYELKVQNEGKILILSLREERYDEK